MELKKILEEFDAYLAAQGRKASTRLAYRTDLGDLYRALKAELGREPTTHDLTLEFLQAYLQQQAEKQRRSTLLRRAASLRAFERYLVDRGLAKPFLPSQEEVRALLRQSREGRATPCLTTEQLRTLWETLIQSDTRRAWRDLALVSLLTEWGFPTERIINLHLEDIDLEEGKLRFPSAAGVELTFNLKYSVGPLRYYVEHVRPKYHLPKDETHLFVSQLGRPLSRQSIWQSLGAWGKLVNFPFALTPRVLRNTAAFRLWKMGTPRELIQQAMGHTNPISTLFLIRRLQQTCGDMPVPQIPIFDPETKTLQ